MVFPVNKNAVKCYVLATDQSSEAWGRAFESHTAHQNYCRSCAQGVAPFFISAFQYMPFPDTPDNHKNEENNALWSLLPISQRTDFIPHYNGNSHLKTSA